MRLEQRVWQAGRNWRSLSSDGDLSPAVVLYFAAPGTLDDGTRFSELQAMYPGAHLLGSTTGGEILDMKGRQSHCRRRPGGADGADRRCQARHSGELHRPQAAARPTHRRRGRGG
jgi:hypothetical protein